jgi:hypothetical protein
LSIAFRMSVYNPTGTRVRGIDASQFQGSGHDWVRAAAPMSAGGGGMSFAFLRATRGGTSGTSTTGSNRVDDPTYVANITGAKAAGLLTGPYHFGRPDLWTPNDSIGLGNAPGSVGTPEDEARHFLQQAGNVMKPGYMRPVLDGVPAVEIPRDTPSRSWWGSAEEAERPQPQRQVRKREPQQRENFWDGIFNNQIDLQRDKGVPNDPRHRNEDGIRR